MVGGELPGHRNPDELTSVTIESLTSEIETTPEGLTWQQLEALARQRENLARAARSEIQTLEAVAMSYDEEALRFRAASQRAMDLESKG